MPPDDGTLTDAKATPADFLAWADRFNKARGWKTLRGSPGTGDTTPKAHLKKGVTAADAAVVKAQADLERTGALYRSLAARVARTPEGKGRDELQILLERMREELGAAEFAKASADRMLLSRQKALKDLTRVEADVVDRLKTLRDEIAKLAKDPGLKGGKADGVTAADESALKAFMDRHDRVQKKVEAARDEVLAITAPDSGTGAEFRAIKLSEFKLLFAMLEKAILLFRAGKANEAEAQIEAAEAQLAEFAVARRSAQQALKPPSPHPEIDNDIGQAEIHIETIRRAGFQSQADALEAELNTRVLAFERDRAGKDLKTRLAPVQEHVRACEALRGPLAEYARLAGQVRDRIALLRDLATGDDAEADWFEDDWANRHKMSISGEISHATQVIKDLDAAIKAARDAQLKLANVDAKALQKQLSDLQDTYTDMFTGKTIKDSQTRAEKGVKKDKRIPREALDEIEMKLLSAQMLLESNSIAALKQAKGLLDSIATYETSVKDDAGDYDRIRKHIAEAEKKVERMASKYAGYLTKEQAELKVQLDQFKEAYPAQSPAEALPKAEQILKRAADLKLTIQGLHQQYKQFKIEVGGLNLLLWQMDEMLSGHKIGDVKLNGYHGELHTRRAEAITLAEKRDAASLAAATKQVHEALADADRWLGVIYSWNAKGRDKSRLDKKRDLPVWGKIEDDARAGQKDADAEKANKKAFEDQAKTTLKKIEAVKKSYKGLKLDTSEIDALALQYEGLIRQTKQSSDYVNATASLAAMLKSAERLDATAVELDGFNKLPVDRAAKECADKVHAFRTLVTTVEEIIEKKGGAAALGMKAGDIKAFFTAVRDAVPSATIRAMEAGGKELAELVAARNESRLQEALANAGLASASGGTDKADDKAAREVREATLGHVRALMRAFESSAAIRRFAGQPFDSDPAMGVARQALERFEMTCLKALAK